MAKKDKEEQPNDAKIPSPLASSPHSIRTDLHSTKQYEPVLYHIDSMDDDGSNIFDVSFTDLPFGTQQSMTMFGESSITENLTRMLSGCWMYKYPRKANFRLKGDEMLDLKKLHRRYFWVNPFSMIISWSDDEPSACPKSKAGI